MVPADAARTHRAGTKTAGVRSTGAQPRKAEAAADARSTGVDAATGRRDVVRNRRRLLAAARQLVAERGIDVPFDEIARAAEVSRTTLHRHFADREEMAAAVLEDNVEVIEARAVELLHDPDGVVKLYRYLLDVLFEVPWLAHMNDGQYAHRLGEFGDRVLVALRPLVDRGHERAVVRAGVSAEDILLTLPMAMAAAEVDRRGGGVDRQDGQMVRRGGPSESRKAPAASGHGQGEFAAEPAASRGEPNESRKSAESLGRTRSPRLDRACAILHQGLFTVPPA